MLRLIFILLLGLAGVIAFKAGPNSLQNKHKFTVALVPPKQIDKFTLGYHEAVADGLWLRVIQGFEICGQPLATAENTAPQKSLEEKVSSGVDFFAALAEEKVKVGCEQGWSYQMLDRITDLSPHFRIAYAAGATNLSVITSDVRGATVLFEKGLLKFPQDWALAYRAAYHHLYEERNLPRAAELLLQAGRNGAPLWVASLASRIYQKQGQLVLGKTVLLEFLAKTKSGDSARPRLEKRLQQIDFLLKSSASGEK